MRSQNKNVLNPILFSRQWCNLVFDGRNKSYGAYVLRRDAGKYMATALAIVVAAFTFATLLPMLVMRLQIAAAKRDAADAIANFSKLKAPEVKKDHELKAVDVAQKVNVRKIKDAIKFVPEISPDEDVEAQLILGADEVGKTQDGQAIVAVPDSTLVADEGTPTDNPGISERYPTPVEVVEQMPQFPGGLSAMMKWIDNHLVYPPMCIRNKVQGRVEVSFLVDEQGNMRDAQVTKSAHPLLDKEALLTIKRMPKWQPGKVKGKVSVVRVTVPIEFTL